MSYDYLPNTNIKLKQLDDMFKMNTDTHLLGNYIDIRPNDVILDIGTNNGALLLYASRHKYKKLIGVDINEKALQCAKENFKLNNIDVEIYNIKVQDLKIDNVDVIICNPPYFTNEKFINKKDEILNARHDIELSLNDLFKSYRSLLKDSGRIYMIYRASKILDIFKYSELHKIKIRKMKFVYDARKDNAISVLLELGKGINTNVIIEKALVINNEEN
ncbi:MAG: methyltransferase [Bacillota bacterium]|jgi:tRNA1(Val) A37 N6-methylase TrmN6|nr:methyltransferase [Bacillota bacterium]